MKLRWPESLSESASPNTPVTLEHLEQQKTQLYQQLQNYHQQVFNPALIATLQQQINHENGKATNYHQ